jgi:hypothetical protein
MYMAEVTLLGTVGTFLFDIQTGSEARPVF